MHGHLRYYHQSIQLSTRRLLNAIQKADTEVTDYWAYSLLDQVGAALAVLNRTSFMSFSMFLPQINRLQIYPPSLEAFGRLVIPGRFDSLARLKKLTEDLMNELEPLLLEGELK